MQLDRTRSSQIGLESTKCIIGSKRLVFAASMRRNDLGLSLSISLSLIQEKCSWQNSNVPSTMPTELEEVKGIHRLLRQSRADSPSQLVEFLHHGNTQIRQVGQSDPSTPP